MFLSRVRKYDVEPGW